MAKTKSQAQRSPLVDAPEVTSKKKMKLRSPSARRVPPRLRPQSPPRPLAPTETTDNDTPPPDVVPGLRQTERAKAILTALDEPRRMKKLKELAKTPPPVHVVQTPPRGQKKVHPPPPIRCSPPRKAKKIRIDPVRNPVSNPVSEAIVSAPDNPPPNKSTKPPARSKVTKSKRSQNAATENPPPLVPPTETLPPFVPPIDSPPQFVPPTDSLPQLEPRRSPRALSKNARQNVALEHTTLSNPPPMLPALSNPPRPQPFLSNLSQPSARRSPTSAMSEDPPMPEFDLTNSVEDDHSEGDDGDGDIESIPSIRCKISQSANSGDEGGEKKRVRGVVIGTNVAAYKHAHNKGELIKVEFLLDGTGPADRKVCSLIVHEIGSVVRDKVPMKAPSFRKLAEKDRQVVYDHLSANFVIDPEDDQLWYFIFKRATERFRDWKADCKVFYREHGPDITPRELLDRPDQWEWLMDHFNELKNQELGEAMSKVRTESERLNHRSGKVPFYQRAAELKAKGAKAHIVAAYAKVYSAEPAGAAMAAQMEERVREALRDQNGESVDGCVLDEQEPFPVETQIRIITEVVGQKRGTYVSGAGRGFKRPPLPRGGPRNSDLTERLKKQESEMVEMKAAFEERIRTLEELVVRGGSANLANQNASEGATSYGPQA